MEITVVGAGVSGLTTAVALQQAGHEVDIVAAELPGAITSDLAAAIWYPTMAAPLGRVTDWSVMTLGVLRRLATVPASGVVPLTIQEHFDHPAADPPWREAVAGFRRIHPAEMPAGVQDGWQVEVVRIEPRRYLRYLMDRYLTGGGNLTVGEVTDLAGMARGGVVVNCTGLAAAALLGDSEVFPIRGQAVWVDLAGIDRGFVDDHGGDDILYALPRDEVVVLGGTRQVGNWSTDPDDATTERILAGCAERFPAVAGAKVIAVKVGLRPGRTEVRVEPEQVDGGWLIHNYGHGGSGYGLSWGCAAEVVDIVAELGG